MIPWLQFRCNFINLSEGCIAGFAGQLIFMVKIIKNFELRVKEIRMKEVDLHGNLMVASGNKKIYEFELRRFHCIIHNLFCPL